MNGKQYPKDLGNEQNGADDREVLQIKHVILPVIE
jgi:hypothetical protein